jgi:hypothetical protein
MTPSFSVGLWLSLFISALPHFDPLSNYFE